MSLSNENNAIFSPANVFTCWLAYSDFRKLLEPKNKETGFEDSETIDDVVDSLYANLEVIELKNKENSEQLSQVGNLVRKYLEEEYRDIGTIMKANAIFKKIYSDEIKIESEERAERKKEEFKFTFFREHDITKVKAILKNKSPSEIQELFNEYCLGRGRICFVPQIAGEKAQTLIDFGATVEDILSEFFDDLCTKWSYRFNGGDAGLAYQPDIESRLKICKVFFDNHGKLDLKKAQKSFEIVQASIQRSYSIFIQKINITNFIGIWKKNVSDTSILWEMCSNAKWDLFARLNVFNTESDEEASVVKSLCPKIDCSKYLDVRSAVVSQYGPALVRKELMLYTKFPDVLVDIINTYAIEWDKIAELCEKRYQESIKSKKAEELIEV